MIRHARRSTPGIDEAQEELRKTREDVELMTGIGQELARVKRRMSQIREQNGFEELMDQLLKPQGRTGSHGDGHTT